MAPRPDPGQQCVGRADRALQVHDGGGGFRVTTTEAGGGVDDARTGLGDADSDGASLAVAAEFSAKLTGSESRADVAPKDESVGMAEVWDYGPTRRQAEEIQAHLKAQASEASGSAVVAEFSAVAFDSKGGAAPDDEIFEGEGDVWCATTVTAAAPAGMAGAAIFPGGDRESADREELAGGGTKTTGAEETDTEVPISEVAPRPDPGRQYVGRAGGALQVHDGGGSSRATMTEAGGGVDDARTGLGDADSDGASLAMEAEFGAELTGSE